MNRIRWYGPTVVLLLAVLMVMVLGPGLVQKLVYAKTDARVSLVREELAQNPGLADLNRSFRKVAEVVAPTVVNVEVRSRGGRAVSRNTPDELWRRFFGPRGPMMPPGGPEAPGQGDGDDEGGQDEEMPAPGSPGGGPGGQGRSNQFDVPQAFGNGSGWVYDEDGHIITNNHVVQGADDIMVKFSDGSERKATVLGTDPKTDIAVLKVDGGNLHASALAKEPVEQGDIVFAFGSPFHFEFSMSQGIVSAKGRSLHIVESGQGYEDFIQTDAAINPGNSGGPLTNIRGQVVGMNSAIASLTRTSAGLGFAIPIDMITDVVDQIVKSGKVVRGFLGIVIDDLTPKMARTFGYDGKGVLVRYPTENSPAAKAGMKSGDIITKVDGKAVDSTTQLRRVVAGYAPGKAVPVELFREGKALTLNVTVAEQPAQMAGGPNLPGGRPDAPGANKDVQLLRKLGIEAAATLSEEVAGQLRLRFAPGVVVRSVRPGSVAASEGIIPRTIITEVQGKPVATLDDLTRELSARDLAKGVRLTVVQNGSVGFVYLELPGGNQ